MVRGRFFGPGFGADKGNEYTTDAGGLDETGLGAAYEGQVLDFVRAYGAYEAPVDSQLGLKGCRYGRPACGHDNGVVGGVFGASAGSISRDDGDIRVAEVSEAFPGGGGEGFDAFDGNDLPGKACEYGGLVSGTGSDLQYAVGGFDREHLCHEANHVGLGNGLAVADGQGAVVVGVGHGFGRDEEVPRNAVHGAEYGGIGDASGRNLPFDHLPALVFAGGGSGGNKRALGITWRALFHARLSADRGAGEHRNENGAGEPRGHEGEHGAVIERTEAGELQPIACDDAHGTNQGFRKAGNPARTGGVHIDLEIGGEPSHEDQHHVEGDGGVYGAADQVK